MNNRGGITNFAFLLARVIIALLFACHGAQKLFGVLGGAPQLHNPLMLTAGIIEFGCGLLIALGLFARIAAFLACGEMAVAYFKMHAPHGFWPIQNKGELAIVYCLFFLLMAAFGAGPYSVDGLIRGKG